jgi:hypothetical protein
MRGEASQGRFNIGWTGWLPHEQEAVEQKIDDQRYPQRREHAPKIAWHIALPELPKLAHGQSKQNDSEPIGAAVYCEFQRREC